MKPTIPDMLRAYLIPASLGAALLETVILFAYALFRVSDSAFQTLSFRLTAAGVVVMVIAVTRQRAYIAFRRAVSERYACCHGPAGETIYLSPACPERSLVMLHLRFSRRSFMLASL